MKIYWGFFYILENIGGDQGLIDRSKFICIDYEYMVIDIFIVCIVQVEEGMMGEVDDCFFVCLSLVSDNKFVFICKFVIYGYLEIFWIFFFIIFG